MAKIGIFYQLRGRAVVKRQKIMINTAERGIILKVHTYSYIRIAKRKASLTVFRLQTIISR